MDKKSIISKERKEYLLTEFTNVMLQALEVTFKGLAKMCSSQQTKSNTEQGE